MFVALLALALPMTAVSDGYPVRSTTVGNGTDPDIQQTCLQDTCRRYPDFQTRTIHDYARETSILIAAVGDEAGNVSEQQRSRSAQSVKSGPVSTSQPGDEPESDQARPNQWSGRVGLPAHIYLHGGGGSPPRKGAEHWAADAHGNRMRFVVYERNDQLRIEPHDMMFPADGSRKYRTLWQNTELMKAVYDEAVRIYQPDLSRITLGGTSRGGHGTMRFGLEYPDLFAALLANQPRWKQTQYGGPGGNELYDVPIDEVEKLTKAQSTPFIGWAVGKRDRYTDFSQHVRAARTLTETRRPFAFAWNNGDHGGGSLRFGQTIAEYQQSLFDRDKSMPVFTGSSCDQDFSEPEGGINLGFQWEILEDTETTWRVKVRNTLGDCSVDVQPYWASITAMPIRVDLIKDEWRTLTFVGSGARKPNP